MLRRVYGRVFLGGCDLGIHCVRYLWRVHVRWVDPEEECLHGTNPQDGGAVEARGVGYPLCEDVLFGHPKDLYVLGTGSYESLHPTHFPLGERRMTD